MCWNLGESRLGISGLVQECVATEVLIAQTCTKWKFSAGVDMKDGDLPSKLVMHE